MIRSLSRSLSLSLTQFPLKQNFKNTQKLIINQNKKIGSQIFNGTRKTILQTNHSRGISELLKPQPIKAISLDSGGSRGCLKKNDTFEKVKYDFDRGYKFSVDFKKDYSNIHMPHEGLSDLTKKQEDLASFFVVKEHSKLNKKETIIKYLNIARLDALTALTSPDIKKDGSLPKIDDLYFYFKLFVWFYLHDDLEVDNENVTVNGLEKVNNEYKNQLKYPDEEVQFSHSKLGSLWRSIVKYDKENPYLRGIDDYLDGTLEAVRYRGSVNSLNTYDDIRFYESGVSVCLLTTCKIAGISDEFLSLKKDDTSWKRLYRSFGKHVTDLNDILSSKGELKTNASWNKVKVFMDMNISQSNSVLAISKDINSMVVDIDRQKKILFESFTNTLETDFRNYSIRELVLEGFNDLFKNEKLEKEKIVYFLKKMEFIKNSTDCDENDKKLIDYGQSLYISVRTMDRWMRNHVEWEHNYSKRHHRDEKLKYSLYDKE